MRWWYLLVCVGRWCVDLDCVGGYDGCGGGGGGGVSGCVCGGYGCCVVVRCR